MTFYLLLQVSDVFIAKKFAKNPAADVENLSEEESEKLKNLIDKGVLFLHVPKKPIVEQWDKEFDTLVSEEAKENKKNYSDQFKWHLFSFDLLPAFTGNEAKADSYMYLKSLSLNSGIKNLIL